MLFMGFAGKLKIGKNNQFAGICFTSLPSLLKDQFYPQVPCLHFIIMVGRFTGKIKEMIYAKQCL